MSMHDFFRRAMGVPREPFDRNFGFRNPIWGEEDEDEDDELDEIFGMTNMMTRQMMDVMRAFQQFTLAPGSFGAIEEGPAAIEEPHPRDRYIKPSYEQSGPKADTDIDGRLPSNFSFDSAPPNRPMNPAFFGQSFTMRTVRGPDGRVETEKSIRRSDGVTEKTVTRTIGDQTHSLTTKTNVDGTTELNEEFINMDEENRSNFDRIWSGASPSALPPASFRTPSVIEPPQESSSWRNFFKWFK